MTFVQFCELHGLIMGDLVEDRWKRVRTTDKPGHRNGAYKLQGDIGWVQNHATMTEVATWRREGAATDAKARPIDHAARERERQHRVQAMRSARAYWAASRPLSRQHTYLLKKGLSPVGTTGLRENDGWLVVPIWNGDWIISIQGIHPDGTKRFWTGAPVKAGHFTIERSNAGMTCIVEGLATGLAVYQSVRQARVIVVFNSGNLMPVVEHLKPTGNVVVCADNDHGTLAKRGFNPGLEAAQNVADRIGCGVAYPEGIEGTDWADWLKEHGTDAARRMERLIQAKSRYVMGEHMP